MITIRELSRLAGVSTATVSFVLNNKHEGRVGDATRQTILDLAQKHGYRANVNARALAEGRTYRIALAIEGGLAQHAILGQFSLYERLGLITESMQNAGYAIEILQVDVQRPAAELCRELSAMAVDGFIFLEWQHRLINKLLHSLHEKRIAAVALECDVDDPEFTWCSNDVGAAFEDATRRLVEQGHDRIAVLDIMPGTHSSDMRDAFVRTMRELCNVDASKWIFIGESPAIGGVLSVVDGALAALPKARAFLLTDNFAGEVVIHGLRQRGLEPKRDVRLIGYGDTVVANRCSPKLSHYSLQTAAQVRFCTQTLLAQIRGDGDTLPRQQHFGPRYVEQGT